MKHTGKVKQYNKPSILSTVYFLLIALVMLSQLSNSLAWLNYIAKPLLMPVLALFFIRSITNYNKQVRGVLLALFCSWLGDVFLLFEPQHDLFFIAGLSAFLLAHLFYIFVFRYDVKSCGLLKSTPYIILGMLLCLGAFLYLLQPNLNELLLPVCVYAFIICGMLLVAILRYGQASQLSFRLCCFGALLFVLSDAIIAINKFLLPFDFAYPLIIVLYAVGQYYIVKSLVVSS